MLLFSSHIGTSASGKRQGQAFFGRRAGPETPPQWLDLHRDAVQGFFDVRKQAGHRVWISGARTLKYEQDLLLLPQVLRKIYAYQLVLTREVVLMNNGLLEWHTTARSTIRSQNVAPN